MELEFIRNMEYNTMRKFKQLCQHNLRWAIEEDSQSNSYIIQYIGNNVALKIKLKVVT